MGKIDGSKIDWRRMAEPQPDRYDTEVTLHFAEASGYKRSPVQPQSVRPGYFFDGAVEIREYDGQWVDNCYPAPVQHPNVRKVPELLRLWPEVYIQFKSLVERVYLFAESAVRQDGVVGSICGPGQEGFGAIATTVTHHVGFAEALVHEMGHHKLRALGVEFESARRILTNAPDEKYPSPIRYDCLRPMTAVLHAQYSYTYISALDVKIVQKTPDRARNQQVLANSLAFIIPKLEFGLGVIREHARVDEAGEGFLEGLYDWTERIIADAGELLRAYGVARQPFAHPIATA